MNIKKRLLSLLLAGSMVLSTGIMSVGAEETNAAEIGGTGYATLAEAVKAANSGDTIKLLKDCEGEAIGTFAGASGTQIPVKDFTIDFDGHTYTVNSAAGSTGTVSQAFHLEKGATVTLKNGTVTTTANSGCLMVLQNYCDLTLTDMTLDGTNVPSTYVSSNNCGNVLINGSTTIKAASGKVAFDSCGPCWTTGYGNGSTVTVDTTGEIQGDIECCATIIVKNGLFNGTFSTNGGENCPKSITISGGYFANDPSMYVEDGKAAVASDKEAYAYMIGEAVAEEAAAQVADPDVKVSDSIPAEGQEVAQAMAEAMEKTPPQVEGLADAADALAAENDQIPTQDMAASLRDLACNADEEITPADISIVIEAYLDVEITNVNKTADETKLTVDITPMYRTLATAADVGKDEITADGDTPNAVGVGEAQKMDITEPVVVTIPLPSEFAGNEVLYVRHFLSTGKVRTYKGSLNDDCILTFTNPDGFSKFEIGLNNPSAAEIGDTGYDTLQDAVDAAKDGDTIKVLKDNESAEVAREISFTLDENGKEGTSVTPAKNYTLDQQDNVYTFKKKPTIGGGGAAETSYAIKVEDAKNGTATADAKTAAEGRTVKVTLKADKNFAPSGITVTDKDGKEVAVKNLGNGVYSFVMPKSDVAVKAAFTEAEQDTSFVDVPSDAYYADAVQWAVDQGVTTGVTPTTFAPNGVCTRAQAVTFLWRAAGTPAPKSTEMQFTDVAADSYYHDAVLWAIEQGITNGTSETTFSPDMSCSRAHIMTFLWRAEGKPVVEAEIPFTDVAADAYYTEAVRWAAAESVTSGTSATTFSPDNACTRAQIVTFLYNCNK